jgi:hypothetical protein
MVRQYFENLRLLWLRPGEFFGRNYQPGDERESIRFANLTGVLVALELGLAEILAGGSKINVILVTVFMLLAMPFLVTAGIYLWSGFVRLCAFLVGEPLPLEPVRQVVAYSVAGIALLGLGFGLGKWFCLAVFVFQVFGIERVLKCSRWTAGIYVGLPFSLLAVLLVFVGFMFKVFK